MAQLASCQKSLTRLKGDCSCNDLNVFEKKKREKNQFLINLQYIRFAEFQPSIIRDFNVCSVFAAAGPIVSFEFTKRLRGKKGV